MSTILVPIDMLLMQQSDALDQVIAEFTGGVRNQAHYDQLDEKLDGIIRGLQGARRRRPGK